MAGALTAGADAGARSRAVAMAGGAGGGHVDRDLAREAVKRLIERDLEIVAQVGAAPGRLALAAAAAHELAKNALEDIGKPLKALAAAAPAAVLEGGMAIAVVRGALLGVLKDVVGFGDRLELGLGVLAAGILVRMVLDRELAVGGLERDRISRPLDRRRHCSILPLPSGERVG